MLDASNAIRQWRYNVLTPRILLLQFFFYCIYFNHNHESGVETTTQGAVAFVRSAETATVTERHGSFRLYVTSVIKKYTRLAENRKQTSNHVLKN